MLWVAIDDRGIHAAMVTELLNYPQCKAVLCLFLGGEINGQLLEFYKSLKAYAKAINAHHIEMITRPGFRKLLKDEVSLSRDFLFLEI